MIGQLIITFHRAKMKVLSKVFKSTIGLAFGKIDKLITTKPYGIKLHC